MSRNRDACAGSRLVAWLVDVAGDVGGDVGGRERGWRPGPAWHTSAGQAGE